MLLLFGDVLRHFVHAGVRNGEYAIAAAPSELARNKPVLVNPMRRAAFEQVHHFLDGQAGWQVDERVDVVRVYEIDFHVDLLLGGVERKFPG